MKKRITLFLIVLMVFSMFLVVGCKNKEDEPTPEPKVELKVEFSTPSKTTLKIGDEVQLSYTLKSESTVTAAFVSSAADVASVSNTGLVTALKKGSATIKVTVTDTDNNKEEKSYTFTVEANTHTLTFDLDGGSMSGETSQVIEEGTEVTLPTPTKEGFEFLGWKKDGNGDYVTKVVVNANTTVKAFWEKVIVYHTVTYSLDGGTLAETTEQVADGEDLVLKTPTKDGFSFLGWTLTADGTEYVRKLTNVTADATVYAHWQQVYTVTYNLDEGTYEGQNQVKGGETLVLGMAGKDDHVFLGWTLTADGTEYISEVTNVSANVTVYAHFKSLAAAIADAQEGDTLVLGPGNFAAIAIDKSLTLLGNNAVQNPNLGERKAETIFNGDIDIKASNVTIKGIMLTGAGRIKSEGLNVENILIENVFVKDQTVNVGNISTNAPFYFLGGTETSSVIKNLTIKNSRLETEVTGSDRPMILYYRDVENLTITGNEFIGRAVNYNDGIKIETTNAAFGVKGNVNICDNYFANFQQYVIWFRLFGAGTYNIKNNTFENIGLTAASHGMATFVKFSGTEEDEVLIDMSYNTMIESMILLRNDATTFGTGKVTMKANYNVMTELKGDYYIKNAYADVKVDGSYNYWSGSQPDESKLMNATANNPYSDALDVPKIGDADVNNNTFTITYDLDGGEWLLEAESTYVYGHDYEMGYVEKEGFTFVHWEDENGQVYDVITSRLHENLKLKAIWAESIEAEEFDVVNLPR